MIGKRVGVFAVLAAVFAVEGAARAEGELTLEAAIARAKASHPDLTRVKASLVAAERRVDVFGAALRPEVGAAASVGAGAFPPMDLWEPDVSVDAGLSLGWTLIDFGRTRAAERAAKKAIDAGREDLKALEQDVALGVTEAFYQALAARELVGVAVVGYQAEKRHREEAERFVQAGQRAAIEVARARTQEARAKTEVVRAEAAANLALVYLARAMGVREVPSGVSGAWAQGGVAEHGGAEAALSQRVELAAARQRVEASGLEAEAAETGVAPLLRADARAGFGSRDLDTWGPSFSAQVTLSWPFLDGGRSRALAEAARAEARAAEVGLEQLAVVVSTEVFAQEVALVSAGAEVEAARAAREAAEVELRLAEARWKEGLGSGIELADAQARLTATDADRTRAELSRALALARLRRALGL